MLTLRNSFHGTETTVRLDHSMHLDQLVREAQGGDKVAIRKLAAIKRRLCTGNGCTCSGPTGER